MIFINLQRLTIPPLASQGTVASFRRQKPWSSKISLPLPSLPLPSFCSELGWRETNYSSLHYTMASCCKQVEEKRVKIRPFFNPKNFKSNFWALIPLINICGLEQNPVLKLLDNRTLHQQLLSNAQLHIGASKDLCLYRQLFVCLNICVSVRNNDCKIVPPMNIYLIKSHVPYGLQRPNT